HVGKHYSIKSEPVMCDERIACCTLKKLFESLLLIRRVIHIFIFDRGELGNRWWDVARWTHKSLPGLDAHAVFISCTSDFNDLDFVAVRFVTQRFKIEN